MRYYIAMLLALNAYNVSAQKHGQILIDSLLKMLPVVKEDTNKAAILDQLSFVYANISPDEGISYGQAMLQLSEKLNWQRGIAAANADLGINYENKTNHDLALDYDQKALQLYQKFGNMPDMAGTMTNMALIYVARGEYPKALKYDFAALKIYEKLHNKLNEAIVLENIGSIYFDQKNYNKTTEYYLNALNIYNALKDTGGIARNFGNIGMVKDAEGDYAEALEYHFKALKINQELGNKNATQINMANIGYVYNHMHNYPLALQYQLMALKLSQEYGNRNSIAINLGNIGETYFSIANDTVTVIKPTPLIAKSKNENIRQATRYLEEAVNICKETNYYGPLAEFSQYLSDAYLQSSNYKKAFEYLRLHTASSDSVFSITNNIQIANLETKREVELRDKDIQIMKLKIAQKHNERTLYFISTALLLLLIGVVLTLLYTYRRSNRRLLREKRKHLMMIEEQIKRIKTQADVLDEIADMQSHNVRGPVATILGLVKLFNFEDMTDPTNKVVIDGIASITDQLDIAVQEVIKKENSLGG